MSSFDVLMFTLISHTLCWLVFLHAMPLVKTDTDQLIAFIRLIIDLENKQKRDSISSHKKHLHIVSFTSVNNQPRVSVLQNSVIFSQAKAPMLNNSLKMDLSGWCRAVSLHRNAHSVCSENVWLLTCMLCSLCIVIEDFITSCLQIQSSAADLGMFDRTGAPQKGAPTKGASIFCMPEKWATPEWKGEWRAKKGRQFWGEVTADTRTVMTKKGRQFFPGKIGFAQGPHIFFWTWTCWE